MDSASDFPLRRCGPADAAALSLVGQATFLEAYAGIVAGADIVAHCARAHAPAVYADWLARADSALWLAERDGAPIGYAVLTLPDFAPGVARAGDLELRRIYVLSPYQRTRLGSRLMEAACAEAKARGAARLLLGVYSRNERALAFYARAGFSRIDVRVFHVGEHDYDDYVLARAL